MRPLGVFFTSGRERSGGDALARCAGNGFGLRFPDLDRRAKLFEQHDFLAGEVALRIFDQRPHVIAGGENGADQFDRRADQPLADLIEGGLAMMGEAGERVEAEHRARALQRMQTAKNRIDLIMVVEVLFKVEKPLLDLFEQLHGLGPENFDRIGIIHLPSTLVASFTS